MERRNLKLYIRIDGSGRDVAGSSVWRKKMPKTGKWRQLQGYECCNPTTTTSTTAAPATTTTTTTVAT